MWMGRIKLGSWMLGAAAGLGVAASAMAEAPRPTDDLSARVERGRELFLREWLVGDSRTQGGDGLGPVFNDSSCVACHNAGGPGGGGPSSKNVDIITASAMFVPSDMGASADPVHLPAPAPSFASRALEALTGVEAKAPEAPPRVVSFNGGVGMLIRHASPFSPGQRSAPAVAPAQAAPDRSELIGRHAGFRAADSVVLHRFGSEPGYDSWRNELMGMGAFFTPSGGLSDGSIELMQIKNMHQMRRNNGGNFQGQAGMFSLIHSQRNPTALFGTGRIDAIPEATIEEAAHRRNAEFPEVEGRVARLKDGRIGRFGWKAQTASLEDFTLTACAVELGLEVPGHSQGGLPQNAAYRPEGLDLSADECDDLTAFIRDLPAPEQVNADQSEVADGAEVFVRIGCATCHAQKLGEVDGLYSDLLLHDLGPELGDVGQYEVFAPGTSEEEGEVEPVEPEGPMAEADVEVIDSGPMIESTGTAIGFPRVGTENMVVSMGGSGAPRPKKGVAGRQEWKTPPLWGLRDSGPYLHDGRAGTIDETVALHGGEASRIAVNYFGLKPVERRQLQAFLRSLAAPTDFLARSND